MQFTPLIATISEGDINGVSSGSIPTAAGQLSVIRLSRSSSQRFHVSILKSAPEFEFEVVVQMPRGASRQTIKLHESLPSLGTTVYVSGNDLLFLKDDEVRRPGLSFGSWTRCEAFCGCGSNTDVAVTPETEDVRAVIPTSVFFHETGILPKAVRAEIRFSRELDAPVPRELAWELAYDDQNVVRCRCIGGGSLIEIAVLPLPWDKLGGLRQLSMMEASNVYLFERIDGDEASALFIPKAS